MTVIYKEIIETTECPYCGKPVTNSNRKMGHKRIFDSNRCKANYFNKKQLHEQAEKVIDQLLVRVGNNTLESFLSLLSDKTITIIGKDFNNAIRKNIPTNEGIRHQTQKDN